MIKKTDHVEDLTKNVNSVDSHSCLNCLRLESNESLETLFFKELNSICFKKNLIRIRTKKLSNKSTI